MSIPCVAIVGRPNVGKSCLFNRLAGRRISIVDPTSGVTRDRVTTEVEVTSPSGPGRRFELSDTGGMGITNVDGLDADIQRQIDEAMQRADLLLFTLDVREGVTALDHLVAERLRHLSKPVLVVANKADTPALAQDAAAFFPLGLGSPIAVSALQGYGRDELLEAILARLPLGEDTPLPDVVLELAIVGRRNAGKSSLVNALAREPRMIVSEIPGTTRDSVDVRFERDGRAFLAIDTAGIRRRAAVADSIQFYSQVRAEKSIRRADVVVLMIDASMPIGLIEKQVASYIVENLKPCVIVVNKWDLHGAATTEEFRKYLEERLPGLAFAPLVFTTAKTGRNAASVVDVAQALFRQARVRVTTGELNRVVAQALEERRPRPRGNRMPKIYYATQTDVAPPTVLLFVNEPELFDDAYRRYLTNRLRQRLPFSEVPVDLRWRAREHEAKDSRPMQGRPTRAPARPTQRRLPRSTQSRKQGRRRTK